MSAGNMGGRSLTEEEMWKQGKITLSDAELIKRGWKKDPNPPKPVSTSDLSKAQPAQQDNVERILKEIVEDNKGNSLLICGFLKDVCNLLKEIANKK